MTEFIWVNRIQSIEPARSTMVSPSGGLFQDRQKRFEDAIRLEVPDRVPLEINFGYFPAKYCGVSYSASYYDCDAWLSACTKTVLDFGADISSVQNFFPGVILEQIDPHIIRWPGRCGAQIQSHQIIDGEYMLDTEYPHLISDTTDFVFRRYMPRMAGVMKGCASISPLPSTSRAYSSPLSARRIGRGATGHIPQ